MRTVHLRLDPNRILEMRQMYTGVIIGELARTRGCLYAGLLQSVDDPEVGISLTLWSGPADADAYERSGAYARLWDQSRPYLAATPDWTVHLTDDLQLQYSPVDEAPLVSRYESPGPADTSGFSAEGKGRFYLRLLSLHVRSGMLEEFSELYRNEIIPGLRKIAGCRSAFLSGEKGDPRRLISVTIWNSRAEAEEYERNGAFSALSERVAFTLENSDRWKAGTQKVDRAVASDDMAATGYTLIVGRALAPQG
ncbi:MAG TPA: antibiotic biosynthesis monooxygenase family protein [Bacteroidota bacterium]|nr:antibiotic biosynthesis monooxygenase family protein [Bacteroidota bacterium]